MSGRSVAAPIFALLLALPAGGPEAAGQPERERPSEDELFGTPSEEPVEAEPEHEAPPTATPGSDAREEELFGESSGERRFEQVVGEQAPEDPLKLGGLFYSRMSTTILEGRPVKSWYFSSPTMVDGYFDARPNDRVRVFALGRLLYDPAVPSDEGEAGASEVASTAGFGSASQLSGQLDQLWLRFDLERTVFATVGRQHVKWGPSRFWNPTDFMHQARRDPLAQFDARQGTSMVKLHFPWEQEGWNFYAIALLEGQEPTLTLGGLGGALRAEIVLGQAELGASFVAQEGHKPKLGFDLSAGLWEFDLYGELAVRRDTDVPLYGPAPAGSALPVVERPVEGATLGAVGGVEWSYKYDDEDHFTLGGEYFFNEAGYEDAKLYPLLFAIPGAFNRFYLGRHYGALTAILPAPGRWNDTTFVLSTIGNLSDRSFVTRLDYNVLLLTHLRFEAFGAVFYGAEGGEFVPEVTLPAGALGNSSAVRVAPRFQAGLGLRVAL